MRDPKQEDFSHQQVIFAAGIPYFLYPQIQAWKVLNKLFGLVQYMVKMSKFFLLNRKKQKSFHKLVINLTNLFVL